MITNDTSRPASRTLSNAHDTRGRPLKGASNLCSPDGATYRLPPPAHRRTAPVLVREPPVFSLELPVVGPELSVGPALSVATAYQRPSRPQMRARSGCFPVETHSAKMAPVTGAIKMPVR